MKTLALAAAGTLAASLVVFALSADADESDSSAHGHSDAHAGDMPDMDHGVPRATGVVESVSADGYSLTVAHGPIAGIGMDAMTMKFDTLGDVDLSGFAAGDEVAFALKEGRDGSYRISAICDTGADGADCLDGALAH